MLAIFSQCDGMLGKVTNIFTNFVAELKSQETINLNMLILANKKFELFLRKIKE